MWKQIDGFPRYYVNESGWVKTSDNLLLYPRLDKYDYLEYKLFDENHKRNYIHAHTIVAKTFLPKNTDKDKNQINHIDGDSLNNHFSNLEWTTATENLQHRHFVLHTNENYVRGVTETKSGKYEAGYKASNKRYRKLFESKEDAYEYYYNTYMEVNGFAPWDENKYHAFTDKETIITDLLIDDVRPDLIKEYISTHGNKMVKE